jgi:hypothetical protein
MTEDELRAEVVRIAASYEGPQDPDQFWARVCPELQGDPHGTAWCGGFALSCLHEAGLTTKPWKPSHGFLLTEPKFPTTKSPLPGDIAYFDKPLQHHAIVREVTQTEILTVDGNQGVAPQELVKLCKRPKNGSSVVFFSIAPLVAAVATESDPA